MKLVILIFLVMGLAGISYARSAKDEKKKQAAVEALKNIKDDGKSLLPLDVLKKHDGRSLGRALVERIRNRESVTHASQGYYNFKKDSKIMMVAFPGGIRYMLENGREFPNCHTVRKALSCGDDYLIYPPEMAMAGFQFPEHKKSYQLLPKYAYLAVNFQHPGMWRTRLDRMYGQVIVVFKDSIKDQVTFSAGNSAIIQRNIHTLDFNAASPFPEPDYQRTYSVAPNWGHHWEAQIWGPVSLSDVDYFMVNCPFFGNISEKSLAVIKSSGKAVYQCQNDQHNSEMIKGQRL